MKSTEVQNKLRINSEASECAALARSLSNRLSIWIIESASISLLSRLTIKAKRIIYPQSLYADTRATHACRISRYRATANNRNARGSAARNVAPMPIATPSCRPFPSVSVSASASEAEAEACGINESVSTSSATSFESGMIYGHGFLRHAARLGAPTGK